MNILAAARALACALIVWPGAADAFGQSGRARAAGQPQQQQQGQSQQPRPEREVRSSGLRVELPTPVAETPVPFVEGPRGGSLPALSFTSPDVGFGLRLVKDSPFAAESAMEHVQELQGGNRMVRKSSARLYRDAAGRTRVEHSLRRGGAAAAADDDPRMVVINDPVGEVSYEFDTRTQTARKLRLPPEVAEMRRRTFGGEGAFGVLAPADVGRRRVAEGEAAPRPPAPKTERLEPQSFDGVVAEGMRTTVTIPAGEFHNEQPMEITHEVWYSPELQAVVMMRHSDPRFGETTYRLTNVVRGEPDRALFELPAGYRVTETRPREFPRRELPPPRRP